MNKVLNFLCNALIGFFIGGVVDYFANTTFIYSLIGLGVGFIVALILIIISNKKEKRK